VSIFFRILLSTIIMPFGHHKQQAAHGFPTNTNANRLDAADGVMDGRYFGTPIAGATMSGHPAARGYGAPAYGAYGAPAYGAYGAPAYGAYGAPAYGYGGYGAALGGPRIVSVTRSTVPLTGYGGLVGGYTSPLAYGGYGAPMASSALALDAADGVIDGRCFGAPIASPAIGYGSSFIGAPAYGYGGYGAALGGARVVSVTRSTVPLTGYGGLVGGYGGYASPVAYGGYAAPAFSSTLASPMAYGGYGAPLLGGPTVVSVTRSTVPFGTTYGGYGAPLAF